MGKSANSILKPVTRTPTKTPWQDHLRAVAADMVTEESVRKMLSAVIKKAEAGDMGAIKFVLESVVGLGRPQTVTQNNLILHQPPEDQPSLKSGARPGTEDKVAAFAARAARGEPLFHDADGPEDDDE